MIRGILLILILLALLAIHDTLLDMLTVMMFTCAPCGPMVEA